MLIRNELLALAEVAHTSCQSKIPNLTILSTSISTTRKRFLKEIVEAKLAQDMQILNRLLIFWLFRTAQ